MKYCMKFIFATCISFSMMGYAFAEVTVIVNPGNDVNSLGKAQVKRIFLGKMKSFPNGISVAPVDQAEGTADRSLFYKKVVNKSEEKLKSYWATIIFSGKGTPPAVAGNVEEVKSKVAKNPNAISYIDSSKLDSSVKSVLVVK